MAILAADIKLAASQVMDDVPEGGGSLTAIAIADGASNAIFPDISELDRAGGRVNLRKVFAHVATPTTDSYLGANVILADPPDDPRVAIALAKTVDAFDRRDDAKSRIEAYLNKGARIDGYLFENHIAGQRSIQLFQREASDTPPIGRTLCLVRGEGTTGEVEQYVRITRVSSETRQFTYAPQPGTFVDYKANVVTCELSDALRHDFPGSPASRDYQQAAGKTVVRDTLVADAAVYCGASKLTSAATIGDLTVNVNSIFTQIVPSAQTETPIIDSSAAGERVTPVATSNGTITLTDSGAWAANTTMWMGRGITPGTIAVTGTGINLTDRAGQLLSGDTVVGTVDYERGVLTLASDAPSMSGVAKSFTFKPAAVLSQIADTFATLVTAENRGFTFVYTINPAPAPGTAVVSYRAQGRWYDLRDGGDGTLRGSDAAIGAGTVSYSTGTVAVTLGALPDVGSAVMYRWGNTADFTPITNPAAPKPQLILPINAEAKPGTVSVTWSENGVDKTATEVGGMLKIGQTVVGYVDRTGGNPVAVIEPGTLPASGKTYSVGVTKAGAGVTEEFASPVRTNGKVNLVMAQPPVRGSIAIELPVEYTVPPGAVAGGYNLVVGPQYMAMVNAGRGVLHLRDDANGQLTDGAGTSFGTVNYTTGALQLTVDFTTEALSPIIPVDVSHEARVLDGNRASYFVARPRFSGVATATVAASMPSDPAAKVKVRSQPAGGTESSVSTNQGAQTIRMRLRDGAIAPGSVAFTMGGLSYFDRNGALYCNLNMQTGAATPAGSVDYTTGYATVTYWQADSAATVSVQTLAAAHRAKVTASVYFRIPVTPVRPGSFSMSVTTAEGVRVDITSLANGELRGKFGNAASAEFVGTIDYEMGVVLCNFANTAQVDGKATLVPTLVYPDTVKYSAVSYSYLPLDADILGLDPVRLPQDGRVPIFRPGSFAVIGHTDTLAARNVSNGQVVSCGRTRLSRVRVIGSNGATITGGYTADLDAGTLTFSNTSGYAQPVTIEHRIEDMLQVSDAQITGALAFTRPLSHAYPVGAVVSSALVAGDMKARVSALFDQATWDGAWSDARVGNQATATFNDALAPVAVTNAGAVTERWAIRFTSTTNFEVIGEHVGVIERGNTASDCAPLNPATNTPYFVIPALGWGSGWAAGNVLRFNTVGAVFPVWVIRTIQQGPETIPVDSFTLLVRGDVDRP